MKGIYRFIRFWSLDIVAGAMASTLFASKILGMFPPATWWIILALTVFLIYQSDHLMDALKPVSREHSSRYRDYFRIRKILMLIVVAGGIIDLLLILIILPLPYCLAGLVPGVGLVIYFFLVHLVTYRTGIYTLKEFWIAGVYSLAIWSGPWIASGKHFQKVHILLFISYAASVLVNVLIYSSFMKEHDEHSGQVTLSVFLGEKLTDIIITLLAGSIGMAAGIGLLVTAFSNHLWKAWMILLVMAVALISIPLNKEKMKEGEHYGRMADAIFLLPALLIVM